MADIREGSVPPGFAPRPDPRATVKLTELDVASIFEPEPEITSFRDQIERENRGFRSRLGTALPAPGGRPEELPEPEARPLTFREQLARESARDRLEAPAPVEDGPPMSFREQMERENRRPPAVMPPPVAPSPEPPEAAPPAPPEAAPVPDPPAAAPVPDPPGAAPVPDPPAAKPPPLPALPGPVARALAELDAAVVAKLAEDLRAGGTAPLSLGGVIKLPPDFTERDLSDADLVAQAFRRKLTPGTEKTQFSEKYARLNDLLAGDPVAQARLGKLLASGALSNVSDGGEPLINILSRIADRGMGPLDTGRDAADPTEGVAMKAAFADVPTALSKLLERLTPAEDDPSPRAMLARSAPGQYAQLVADLALGGNVVVSRQLTYGNDYYADDVVAEAAGQVPPADVVDYTVDLAWLRDDDKISADPRYQAVLEALREQPEARTALALLAKKGVFSDKGYYAPGGHYSESTKTRYPTRESPLSALAKLADPATPLAPGIDRSQLLAEVVSGLATPYPTITQGEWQTCTVATIQRLYAEHRPEEYIRVITGLASPEGKVRLAEGKGEEIARPADWNASEGDGRTPVNRLFQSAMMDAAVKAYNQRIYDEAGFVATGSESATYSNATDEWFDPYGNRRRGLPDDAVRGLASQLEGRAYATLEIPPMLASLVTPDLIEKIVQAFPDRKTSNGISNVPMTLELTAGGKPYLHEVLLGSLTKGPPPMATLIDPADGRTRQMEVGTLAKSIRSMAVKKEDLDNILGRIGSGMYDGFLGSFLGSAGDKGKAFLGGVLPLLLPSLIKADVGDRPFKAAVPPAGSPSSDELAPILEQLAGESAPVARFALHDLVQAGALDQRTEGGRQLLADLRDVASGEVELPEGMTPQDALEMMLLDTADDVADGGVDAGGTRGRRFIPDAGGTRGRRFIPDAGGTRGRRFIPDAGGTRGRRFIPDAGGTGPGDAQEYLG